MEYSTTIPQVAAKTCPACKENKPLTDFYKDKQRRDGFSYRCRPCILKYLSDRKSQERYERQQSGMPDFQRWATVVNRRALEYTSSQIIPQDIKNLWLACSGRCMACQSHGTLNIDHIMPYCCGGDNIADNIQILCERCNSLKGGFGIDFRVFPPECIYNPFPTLLSTDVELNCLLREIKRE